MDATGVNIPVRRALAGVKPATISPFSSSNQSASLALRAPRFRFALLPGTRVDRAVAVTLSPRGPLPMRLHGPGDAPPPVPVAGNVREMVRLPA
jgi:hypothetical protein